MKRRFLYAGGAVAVVLGLAVAYVGGDWSFFGPRTDSRPLEVIFESDHVELQPGELRRFDFTVPRVLNFGYHLKSDVSPISGCVIKAADWSDFADGKQVWAKFCENTKPPPDWITGGGGLSPDEYAYGLRCLETSKTCEGELRLALYDCPPQGCFSGDPDGDGARNS